MAYMTSDLIRELQDEIKRHGDRPIKIFYSTDGGEETVLDARGIETVDGVTYVNAWD